MPQLRRHQEAAFRVDYSRNSPQNNQLHPQPQPGRLQEFFFSFSCLVWLIIKLSIQRLKKPVGLSRYCFAKIFFFNQIHNTEERKNKKKPKLTSKKALYSIISVLIATRGQPTMNITQPEI